MEKRPSPYLCLSRDAWAQYRHDTPLTLTASEVRELKGQSESISIQEVETIYLPLSRLLNLYVAASQELYKVTTRFLGHPEPRVPYIIGVSGSVGVGKSTVSRVLRALLSRWPNHPRVEVVTTDGFLHPNAWLKKHRMMERKGFPESYDVRALLQFLTDVKGGAPQTRVPLYSHHIYDVVPNEWQTIERPDIVIVEGLNVLQVRAPRSKTNPRFFVSDFFDFTVYVDAPTALIRQWYLERFSLFRERARADPSLYFHRFATWSDERAMQFASRVWGKTNEVNLERNILPYKERARLILEKAADHSVKCVYLRRI